MSERQFPPTGRFNIAKCIQYLRLVGVDVTDEQMVSWDLSERVYRFLSKERRTKYEVRLAHCQKGHEFHHIASRRNRRETVCPDCGGRIVATSLVYAVARDGSVRDYRPKDEQWRPLPEVPK